MCSRDGPVENGGGNHQDQPHKDKSRSSSTKARAANGDRVRDRNGYRQRAAAFCARLTPSEDSSIGSSASNTPTKLFKPQPARLEVLLVSGRREGSAENYWVLPGGGVEHMESTEEAVVRELREEAGILGKVLFLIGKYIDDQRFHHTTLYFLTVVETFDEWENCQNGRERRWMGMEEARRSIKQNQSAMLEQSIGIIERTLSEHSNNGGIIIPLPMVEHLHGNGPNRTALAMPQPPKQSLLPNKAPPMAKSASLD